MTDEPDRLGAALADRYSIERQLGSGGMATVYLARDLKHERSVAVKVLRPELAAVLGAERFLREIKIAAKLSHPHILPLHDSGQADGFLYYVMPYVEGESLRDKLEREKQLSLDEALKITGQVASALDYAHRQGIVHRDIKPENVLLHEGEAMVADFGIALAVRAAGGERLTETGLSLGTPQYMSPEQATGDMPLDARSDVYSLASVLYEMLAGEPPYTGPTVQAILAKLVMEPARDLRAVRDTVPDGVALAVMKALAKLPADRFAGAAQFAEALTSPSAAVALAEERAARTVSEPALRMRRRQAVTDWRIAGAWLVASLAVIAALWGWLRPTPEPQLARFVVAFPPDQGISAAHAGTSVAVSPDGASFVYVGDCRDGRCLYAREIGELEARLLPGTEDARDPFFSPDGRWIGFGAEAKLKKVALAGGSPLTIAESRSSSGATWTVDDIIVFAPEPESGLWKVPASGGAAEPITQIDAASDTIAHRWPEALPGKKAVLVTISRQAQPPSIAALSLETGELKPVLEGATHARYAKSGHLLYSTAEGDLLAVPFDLSRLQVTGPRVPILDDLTVKRVGGGAEFSISDNGTLVYISGTGTHSNLVLVDRQGVEQLLFEELFVPLTPRFSPDGRRIALTTQRAGTQDIWILELSSRRLTRLTYDGVNYYPQWSRDGTRVLFSSVRSGTRGRDLLWKSADGSGEAQPLLSLDGNQWEGLISPDGRWLVYREVGEETGRDILVVPLDDEQNPRPLVRTPFDERSIALSPNGRWLAYNSDESGQDEVYVTPFPEGGGRRMVSSGGGREPVWSSDGRELFYRSGDRLISVAVETEPAFSIGTPETLFERPFRSFMTRASYDIHPDGDRFVMMTATESVSLVVVLNWFEELRRPMN
ncbi:MAG: protein kinase [Gemmatimonadota bacterium]|nr:MAG: protein kinase [Gemmatimonadota bacterium]